MRFDPTRDPELARIFKDFHDEVDRLESSVLSAKQKDLVKASAILAAGGRSAWLDYLQATSLKPVEVREVIYQATAYLGAGRTADFLQDFNSYLGGRGTALPLPDQGTTSKEDHLEKGAQAQIDLFGEGMRGFYEKGAVNYLLAENCFGDYYTRKQLDYQERELVTFILLTSLGCVEPQAESHAKANLANGNGKDVLMAALLQALPYVGYPRTLNGIAIVNRI